MPCSPGIAECIRGTHRVEDERASLAREVHDKLGQALTGLNMDLAWLEKRLPK